MNPDEPSTLDSVSGLPTEQLLEMVGGVIRGMLETREVAATFLVELRRRDLTWDRIFDEARVSRQLAESTLGPDFAGNCDLRARRDPLT